MEEAMVRRPRILAALDRLLGRHEHAWSAWTVEAVMPHDETRMMVMSTRSCAHCERFQFRREIEDIPASGFPYELHLGLSAARPL